MKRRAKVARVIFAKSQDYQGVAKRGIGFVSYAAASPMTTLRLRTFKEDKAPHLGTNL
jgi:hypothetical protein